MAKLEFENLEFMDKKNHIEVTLLRHFFFDINKKDLDSIGEYGFGKHYIEFSDISEKQASKKFNFLISEGMGNLRSKLNNKSATYIHRNSGIPLMGNLFFGIVDRGTTIIEVKPLTGCNINCIFCSVDEGISSKKINDYIIEEEYLVEELNKLLDYKKSDDIEVFINPQGEPLLYADLVKLVEDIKKIGYVKRIGIATNGALLDIKLVDDLEKAGLTHIHMSINSLDETNSRIMAGTKNYDILKIKSVLDYIVSKSKIELILTPVWVPGVNDKDVEDIAEYCKEKGCRVGIQKFIRHKKGRNPKNVMEMDWPDFFQKLEEFEGKYNSGMIFGAPKKTKELPNPFKTGDKVSVEIVCNGRHSNEKIGVVKARSITIYDCDKGIGENVKVKIVKSKNNNFYAK